MAPPRNKRHMRYINLIPDLIRSLNKLSDNKKLKEGMLEDCNKEAPKQTGNLIDSSYVDKDGLVYDTDYAASVYFNSPEHSLWIERTLYSNYNKYRDQITKEIENGK